MAVSGDKNMLSIVFKLMDRGLSGDEIDRSMKQMIGNDWKEISVDVWLSRLMNRGYVLQDDQELTINDLEAFVKGRIALEDLGRNRR